MKRILTGSLLALYALCAGCAQAQPTEKSYQAAPCKAAPRIDGIEGQGEWDAATRAEFSLALKSGSGESRPVRPAQMRFMNSAKNLYVAFRVPDAARNMQTSPVLADLVILAFCRGEEVAEGDDRRVLLPGLYADKHFLSPGKDADDTQRDGTAVMRWNKTSDGGEYFVEWQIPLDSKDKNDISAVPGGRLRFNLAYADRFSPTLAETEIGGIFGADTDHAKGWGTLVLADNIGVEAPAPAPDWLAKLFPNTDKTDRLENRLRRLDASELDVNGRVAGSVTVELKYPGLDGKDETGKARIFLPPAVKEDPTRRVSLVHVAGYEIDEGGASGLMAKGYAVCTPHAHPLNPLGRGINLDRAIMHAVRRLDCIDPLRVSIQGGSAGGWMTMMLTADAFPLVWAIPDVPPIHWGYNAGYIDENKARAAAPAGGDKPRMPVLLAVSGITDQAKTTYGMPFDSATYLATSPLAHLETITVPTLLTFSTADMLVPVDQVGKKMVKPLDPKLFPEGFSTAMTDRFPGVNGKRTLLDALPAERYELFALPPIENPTRLKLDGSPMGPSKPLVLPFSKERLLSIVVIDEGPVEPEVGHFKYHWSVDHEPFRKWADARGVTADQLTMPKLQRLMKRFQGQEWRPFKLRPGGKGEEVAGTQLDYPEAERADVLLGLRAFATDDACATRLAELYVRLPHELKALGDRLGDGSATSVRAALDKRPGE